MSEPYVECLKQHAELQCVWKREHSGTSAIFSAPGRNKLVLIDWQG